MRDTPVLCFLERQFIIIPCEQEFSPTPYQESRLLQMVFRAMLSASNKSVFLEGFRIECNHKASVASLPSWECATWHYEIVTSFVLEDLSLFK